MITTGKAKLHIVIKEYQKALLLGKNSSAFLFIGI